MGKAREVPLEVIVLKQRGGITERKALLSWELPSLRITDKSKPGSGLW